MINSASWRYRENALLNPSNMTLNFYRPSKYVSTRDYLKQYILNRVSQISETHVIFFKKEE